MKGIIEGISIPPVTGTSGTSYTWYPVPNKSSACPHCTPRCPHGYPADQVAQQPFVSPFFWSTEGPVGAPPNITVRWTGDADADGNVWTSITTKDQS